MLQVTLAPINIDLMLGALFSQNSNPVSNFPSVSQNFNSLLPEQKMATLALIAASTQRTVSYNYTIATNITTSSDGTKTEQRVQTENLIFG